VLGLRQQLAHVIGHTRHAAHTRARIEPGFHFLDGHALFAHEIAHDRRINIATARAHHQTFQRCKAHRRVYRSAMPDGTRRAAVAEMQGNDAHLIARRARQLGVPQGHGAVRQTVKAVAPNSMSLRQIIGQRIRRGVVGQGLMKGGVKGGHHGQGWP
jgi:hypothetical protein